MEHLIEPSKHGGESYDIPGFPRLSGQVQFVVPHFKHILELLEEFDPYNPKLNKFTILYQYKNKSNIHIIISILIIFWSRCTCLIPNWEKKKKNLKKSQLSISNNKNLHHSLYFLKRGKGIGKGNGDGDFFRSSVFPSSW